MGNHSKWVLDRFLPFAAWGFVLLVLLVWVVVGLANLDTQYYMNHVTGAWIAMSHWTLQGRYYPPLQFDGFYAGTRFGPLAIALQSLAYKITGHPIIGAKLLHMLYMLATMAGLFVILKKIKLPSYLAALLAVFPLLTWIGWEGTMTIRHDLLPVALQLGALVMLLTADRPTRLRVCGAALLCALAPLSKISGLWGTAACGLYLLFAYPGLLLWFAPVWFVTLGTGIGVVQIASQGNFFINMKACLFGGDGVVTDMSPKLVVQLIYSFFIAVYRDAVLWVMIPLALIGAWVGRRQAPSIAVGILFGGLMTAYLWTKSGVSINHLVDMVMLAVLGFGLLLSHLAATLVVRATPALEVDSEQSGHRVPNHPIYALAAAIMVVTGLAALAVPRDQAWGTERIKMAHLAAKDLSGKQPLETAEQQIRQHHKPGEHLLSIDAAVPILLGQNPVVLDAWMLRVFFKTNPQAEAALIKRIEAKEFDGIVEFPFAGKNFEWPNLANDHWGPNVVQAFRENYIFEQTWGYSIYRPRPEHEPSPASGDAEVTGEPDILTSQVQPGEQPAEFQTRDE